jgi:hypothetical protein
VDFLPEHRLALLDYWIGVRQLGIDPGAFNLPAKLYKLKDVTTARVKGGCRPTVI